jgi:hypothetical protein
MRKLGGVAGVDDVYKLNALYYAASAYVEAGNDSFGQQLELHKILQDA